MVKSCLRYEGAFRPVSALKELSAARKWILLLTGLTYALGAANVGKAVIAVQYAIRLPGLAETIPLWYLAAAGGFWGAGLVICAIGLSRFRNWARWSTLAMVTLYQANVWVNHLLIDMSDYARQTRPRDLLLSATVVLIYWIGLGLPALENVFEKDQAQPYPMAAGDEERGSKESDQ